MSTFVRYPFLLASLALLIGCSGDTDTGDSGRDSDAGTDAADFDTDDPCTDSDGDEYGDGCALGPDCDDNNGTVNPGETEVPYNGTDDDCDSVTRDDDLDNDGVVRAQDCNDNDADISPNASEIPYNGADDDCDSSTPDDDLDDDGVLAALDCDDGNPDISPNVTEVLYNGADDDCDSSTPDDDLDDDGVLAALDCDDGNPDISPNVTEVLYNGVDDDCDPSTPDTTCIDDAFDQASANDVPADATQVADANSVDGQYESLMSCGTNEDWYRIDVLAGDGLEVDVRFDGDMADIDVNLFRGSADDLQLVAFSNSSGSHETVYEQQAAQDATYWIAVFHYDAENTDEAPYSMTVNRFTQCIDDTVNAGEHNDSATDAIPLVNGQAYQVCDYDDDWYSFTVDSESNVRLDLLFSHEVGDLDMTLFAEASDTAIVVAETSSDNETIEQTLAPGNYVVQVNGFEGATGPYQLFRNSGVVDTNTQSFEAAVAIPDTPGEVDLMLDFADSPAGTYIRTLTIREMRISHTFLRDLIVTATYNGEDRVTLWDRDGDSDGGDGGLDDDFLPFTSDDIYFVDRTYEAFEGLDASGIFGLRVEDEASGDIGDVTSLIVEVEFYVP